MKPMISTTELVSMQQPNGSFRQPSELTPSVAAFFASNNEITGPEFTGSFANQFGIENLAIKDRHYKLYQRILFDFKQDQFENTLDECKFFSDPLATSLLLRQSGHSSHPCGFISLDIWDTCYAAWRLLLEAQLDAASRCVLWILDQQKASGGWACSTQYPLEDSDTTAAILILLNRFQFMSGVNQAVRRGFDWLDSLETEEGSIKTFNEVFGVPSPDTTAATLVAKKVWGREVSSKSLEWLKMNNESYWYTSNSRMNSCLQFLHVVNIQGQLPLWGAAMNESSHNIRFMGNIYINSPLWRKCMGSLSNCNEAFELIA